MKKLNYFSLIVTLIVILAVTSYQGIDGGWAAPTLAFFKGGWALHGRAHPRATEKNLEW